MNRAQTLQNPLRDLISDEVYDLLSTRGLINEKSVRDYQMRKKFKLMRANNISVGDSIYALRKEYPYLQFDSIRKIVYQNPKQN
jgi:hypothetical protein